MLVLWFFNSGAWAWHMLYVFAGAARHPRTQDSGVWQPGTLAVQHPNILAFRYVGAMSLSIATFVSMCQAACGR